ncbi:MAG: tRNA (adenosine(37)-N6)-threonylcarbamoyltransferase complex dimerization subunit type 1 TsaB [Sediminibacterium sp.]
MAKFLIIDTALEEAIVALSNDGKIIAELTNQETQSHANFIQVAIAQLLATHQLDIKELDAIAVTLGPGSYTGLRVGLASAKGIAYTLQKPLIGLSTLSALAFAAIKLVPKEMKQPFQIFSMIDARRMEIFGAIYDAACKPFLPEQAIVLDESKWNSLIHQPTICIGNGITKTKAFKVAQKLIYLDAKYTSHELVEMAMIKWNGGQFEDLAYVGPNYLKEVYILPSK